MHSYRMDQTHDESMDPGMPQVVVLRMTYQWMINYNYLVVDPHGGQSVIVDPAWEMDKVDRALENAQATLACVLLTHSHPDHVHLAKAVAKRYGCPICMSKEEIAASGFNAPQLVALDETIFSVGQLSIHPILTPGHTSGSVCFKIGDNLFTGDVLFAEGCGICPNLTAAHAMFASLEKLKRRLDPHTRIFPGHSYGKEPGRPFSQLMRENIYLQFPDQDSFASFRLRKRKDESGILGFK